MAQMAPPGRTPNRIASIVARVCLAALLTTTASAGDPADPMVRDTAAFDARRPLEREGHLHVADGFTVAAVGDLIISRPLAPLQHDMPPLRAALDLLRGSSVAVGNLETTVFDAQHFAGSAYSWDGDWTNAAVPAVIEDLKAMGFDLLGRANNHVLDWGLEGMRETGHRLDEAGLAHAGVGETVGLARAPAYFESATGRIALLSVASTFRPGSEALPAHDATPGRPGLSALHVSMRTVVPEEAMRALARTDCVLHKQHCDELPAELNLFGQNFRLGHEFAYEHSMDPEDLANLYRSIRTARQHADFVILALHSHECSRACDDEAAPRAAADFLKDLAHGAVDAGVDLFITSGNHNLGALEIYDSPGRGPRPVFYGLGNFIWSDVQELLPHDLYQGNRELLRRAWQYPERATPYDLTAPLNRTSFAHPFTFDSMIARCRYSGGRLEQIELHPVNLGYGSPLLTSGVPRLMDDPLHAQALMRQVLEQNRILGLPALTIQQRGVMAVIRPATAR